MILTGININTRYAFAEPLKEKSSTDVLYSMKKILDIMKQNNWKMDVF